ncbi:actin-like ATPase domain-containing protein [Thozetella sp. PMI_491]|nr:actin-like ATPase domain-containing protein [Thozetella sp. PMI_491]
MSGSASLPHRSVASIRSPVGAAAPAGPGSPHTPLRTIASTFASPSSLRAEEDVLVIEIGTRKLRAGFAGDPVPRGTVCFGPELHRRVGDYRAWDSSYHDDWRKRAPGPLWGKDHELWRFDIRDLDLGLVGDKLERALREAFTKYLLVDSRPRKMVCVLSSAVPTPLLSAVLDALFNRFQAPAVSLFSSPLTAAVAAGVRSSLVVDLGWTETVVTSIYEYREVHCSRSIRGGRMLVEQMHRFLAKHLAQKQGKPYEDDPEKPLGHVLSFEECDEVVTRAAWCKPSEGSLAAKESEGLPTVQEQDESEHHAASSTGRHDAVNISLHSTTPPVTLQLHHEQLSEPVESTFFESQFAPSSFDDHELPVHHLVYRSLLELPMDVRAVCMSRIIFTGGCADVLGLRSRIFDDVSRLVRDRGWDPVQGSAVEKLKTNPKLKKRTSRQASEGPTDVAAPAEGGSGKEQDGVWHDAANATPEVDPIDEQLKRGSDAKPKIQGQMRAIDSLGAWSGASLVAQLKVPAIATIDRELWLAQGAAGASRAHEVDFKAQQRQSMGPGGLMKGAASGASWTLGAWGGS